MATLSPTSARAYAAALRLLRRDLKAVGPFARHEPIVDEINAELRGLYAFAEDLALPDYSIDRYHAYYGPGGYKIYRTQELLSFIDRILIRLDAITTPSQTEELPQKAFKYVADEAIKRILRRDYAELARVSATGCSKSQLVLAGSCIEGILYDQAAQHRNAAVATTASAGQTDITKWSLGQLIAVCRELDLVPPGVEKLTPGLRDYRNLVHPAVEIRDQLVPGEHEAHIAVRILHMLDRDLSEKIGGSL